MNGTQKKCGAVVGATRPEELQECEIVGDMSAVARRGCAGS